MTRMKHRTRPRIISDVLTTTGSSGSEGGATVSMLMRTCHLSYSTLEALLSQLLQAGLLQAVRDEGTVRYTLSSKGSNYLKLYSEFEGFADSYGLKM
jgi:predicted transcriptional regulator